MKAMTWTGAGLGVLLCLYVAFNALKYLDPGFSGPDFIMANAMASPWLPIHAGLAAAALVLGPLQFVKGVRARWPRVHRWTGRAYLTACLTSGAAGLVLSFGTQAGHLALGGFLALSVLSIFCAIQAWMTAMNRQFHAHREWVIRSYALILAGVTLRLWIPAVLVAGLPFMESYRVIAWLSWVPNLAVAEAYLALTRPRRRLLPAE